jgi:hypothetical protein
MERRSFIHSWLYHMLHVIELAVQLSLSDQSGLLHRMTPHDSSDQELRNWNWPTWVRPWQSDTARSNHLRHSSIAWFMFSSVNWDSHEREGSNRLDLGPWWLVDRTHTSVYVGTQWKLPFPWIRTAPNEPFQNHLQPHRESRYLLWRALAWATDCTLM